MASSWSSGPGLTQHRWRGFGTKTRVPATPWRMGAPRAGPAGALGAEGLLGYGTPALAHGRPQPGGAEALRIPAACLGACAAARRATGSPSDGLAAGEIAAGIVISTAQPTPGLWLLLRLFVVADDAIPKRPGQFQRLPVCGRLRRQFYCRETLGVLQCLLSSGLVKAIISSWMRANWRRRTNESPHHQAAMGSCDPL